jgi:tRNA-specific 2-thiouridylase
MNNSVFLGLSGGVDSSVAALLLKQKGYDVTAVFMKNWEEDDTQDYCAAAEDLAVVEEVAGMLDIPLRTVNFSAEYWDRVFEHFLHEYRAGRTPNPDVLCNREVKFKAFLDYALENDASKIATGHYADVYQCHGNCYLGKAADEDKDQTYFLYAIGQRALSHTLFPLAVLKKAEVREIARSNGFPNHARKDSTGICFIGERRFRDFLSEYIPAQPGEIRQLDEKVVGEHHGLMFYTIGQRQGLGIGGPGEPWFVVSKDIDNNVLYVVEGKNHPALFSKALLAEDLHWITRPPDFPFACTSRIRHRQPEQQCVISQLNENELRVDFDQPQRAIAPGQSVVFYDGDLCIGGGIISSAAEK